MPSRPSATSRLSAQPCNSTPTNGADPRSLRLEDLRPKRLRTAGIEAVILDFDGTLAESSGIWKEVDRIFFERRGLTFGPDYAERLSVLGFEDGARYTIETYGLTDTVEQICAEWNELGRELYRDRVTLRPGVEAYLQALRNEGVPYALATTNAPEVVRALEPRLPINELFPVRVHGCEVAHHTKDDPDIYLEATRRLGALTSEQVVALQASGRPTCAETRDTLGRCLVFEDILPAIQTARRIGMRPIGVKTRSSHQDFAAIQQAADLTIIGWEGLA